MLPIYNLTLKKITIFESDGIFHRIWDLTILLFLLLNVCYIPINFGFSINKHEMMQILMEDIPIIIFTIDSIIFLNTNYYDKGVIVKDRFLIFKNYIKNYFLLDLISIGPYYIKQFLNSNINLEMFFLFRVVKLHSMSKKIEDYIHLSDRKQSIFELIKLLFIILYVAHVCGCIWHFVSIWQISLGKNDTWLHVHGLIDEDWIVVYINSLYYSVLTMITVAYVDTNSPVEKFISIFLVLCLSGIFAYSINMIGIIVQQMDKGSTELR